jgi:hypothetical protein
METILAWDWDTSEKVEYILKDFPKDEEIIDFLKQEIINIMNK